MEKLEIFKQVGRNIQQIRIGKGLSQVDLVGRIEGNIDTTNISRIEQGRTNPTLLTLYRIAQALEVSLSDLVANNMVKIVEK
ncbi:DNA-binding helix-turn-helix protein [Capnocytophaga sp. oral taxon 863 str. F0517]|uniref:helix-turn-helix domain-containing protein n=1 Tax=Capnocytophaga sp. oral taxon 863 TaxID=1227265 RepID=UPI0003968038|nr:helix-turn-helix transcriptional regulator [Capnocytophaga sp. oral taxon 863]ERI64375.1 DNA-binding helix-turn-helix protein [Capnocytophaga sp. oral taxon 863 str. F0517]